MARSIAEIYLDFRMTRPGIPGRTKARRFSKQLERQTGCQLAWHWLAKKFVVTRKNHGKLYTYTMLKPEEHYPLSTSLIPRLKRYIQYVDWHRREVDAKKAFDREMRENQDAKKEAIRARVEDARPELASALKFDLRKALEGKHSQRVHMLTE